MGIELESIVVPIDDLDRPAPHDLVRTAAAGIPPLPGGARITFEPGGQIELSSPPHCGIAAACSSMEEDLALVGRALQAVGVEMLGVGLDPFRPTATVLAEPRYRAMERYFRTDGGPGMQMMCSTAALQVNLDMGKEADWLRRWRLVGALAPVLTATFANSPFTAGSPNGFRSGRAAVWDSIEGSRTAPVPTSGSDPAAGWIRYALAARVMLIRVTERRFEPVVEQLPFRAWMEEGHELGYPTIDDFAYHLTTLFPPVRPRGWLELRMIDSLPSPWWRVAVAVTTALLEDEEAADTAVVMTGQSRHLRRAAYHGLVHPELARSARACFEAALCALPRLGVDRATIAATASFLDRFVARGRCPADDLLDGWRTHGSLLLRSLSPEEAWS